MLVWPWKETTHNWEQLPTDLAMNKSLSCSYWFFPELTQSTANFFVFGLENKNSLYGGLCIFTEISLYIDVPQKNIFKALHKEGLHTKCLLLLMWTIQISIISSVRKAEEICMLLWERQKKNLYAFSPLQIMQAPTWSPLELLNSNRLCWSHIKSQNTSLLQIMQHTICTLCQIAEI